MSEDTTGEQEQSATTGPRLGFPIAVVIIQLAVMFGFNAFGSTNVQNIFGLGLAPLVAAILLSIWWLRSKGVPRRDRLIGFIAFLAVIVFIVLLHGQNGMYLLILALPVLTTAIILKLLLTSRWPWPSRRFFPLIIVALWTLGFGLVRVDAIGGDLIPLMSWRWTPISTSIATQVSEEPITLPNSPSDQDWPEFRGTRRDGQSTTFSFATDWNENPPKELWRKDVGLGWSSFTVIGDYIFTQEQRDSGEFVVCYEANTGNLVWTNYVDARFVEGMGDGPRATPTFVDGKLYTQGATGILQCLNADTGEAVWKRDVGEDTGAKLPMWGFASSPLFVDEKVIVFTGADAGKSVIAYHSATGEIAWTAGDGDHGYGSGHLAEFDGTSQLLMISNFGIQSFIPETGEQLWEHSMDIGTFARVVQPLLSDDDSVFIGSSFGKGSRRLTVTKEDDTWNVQEDWTSKKIRPYFNDCVVHEGYIYGYDGNRIACIDASTGEATWKSRRVGGQVLLLPEMDILLSLTEKGEVLLISATPDEYTIIARIKALTKKPKKTWNHPVIAQGKLFVRNSTEAVCYKLSPS